MSALLPPTHAPLMFSRKSKCDGQQPVCGPCRDSGRADEVSCSLLVVRRMLLVVRRMLFVVQGVVQGVERAAHDP